MKDEEFLEQIKKAFYTYLETGSRSNEKLKVLHGAIAKDIQNKLGEWYKIHSLNFECGKEKEMNGRYTDKRVDIGIEKDGEIIAGIALKFIMRNYKQNSINYFENMLGETANIRSKGKPYFHIVIIPSRVPYFDKDKVIKNMEEINEENLKKYIKLSNDSISKNMHTPNKTLIYLVDITPEPDKFNDFEKYKEFYKKNKETVKFNKSKASFEFGDNVIYNDYEEFIKEIIKELK